MAIIEGVELSKITGILLGGVWVECEEGTAVENASGLQWKNEGVSYFTKTANIQAVRTK